MNTLEKLPPQALEMEANVLGSMLLDREAALAVMEMGLRPEHFYRGSHRTIYQVACEVFDRDQALDQSILREELDKRSRLEEVGGVAYLAELVAGVATSAHARQYGRHVMDRALARAIIEAGTDMVRDGFEPGQNARDLLERAEQRVFALSQDGASPAESAGSVMHEVFRRIESGGLSGIPTGFRDLDEISGGFRRGELVILAGRPSTGKTSLALNMVWAQASRAEPVPVLFVSLEMTKVQTCQNLACLITGTDSKRLQRGQLNAQEHAHLQGSEDMVRFQSAPIYFEDPPEARLMQLRAAARRMVWQHGAQVIYVDYLQLVRGPESAADQSRQQEVAAVSAGLKGLARELAVPVVALCQLNRSMEERNRSPQLSDLRESGAIENDADLVVLLHWPDRETNLGAKVRKIEGKVAKNRNGPCGNFDLTFRANCFKFEDYAPDIPDAAPQGDDYFAKRYGRQAAGVEARHGV